jgi:hypothetical protein
MKYSLFYILLAAVLWSGCEEKALEIPDLQAGARKVLVEELTGVRCQNCPDGTRDLVSLQQTYGAENLIVVSIHAAIGFSAPYTSNPASQYDFRFDAAGEMASYIGIAEGYPTATINRQLLPGGMSPFISRAAWPGTIANEFDEDYGLDMFMGTTYEESSRKLTVNLNVAPSISLPGEHRLTVLITQDSIVDVQLDGSTRVPNYIHRHVLRDIASKPDGDILEGSLTAGALISRSYTITLDPAWDPKHCSVVAFVSRGGNPDKEVLQVTEKHVE